MSVNVRLGDEQGLDRSRRYLRPVARLPLEGQPDDTHWAVYQWLPQFEAWATGTALCGYSTQQGSLPEDTTVTCVNCEEYRPTYERMLDPTHVPGSDVPMTAEELRDTLAEIIHGHSRKDSSDWDINQAMNAVEAHVAYRIEHFLAEQTQEQVPPTEGDQRPCGYTKRHPSHTFMRLEVPFQCPGEHEAGGER
jgi:hypothetical protein